MMAKRLTAGRAACQMFAAVFHQPSWVTVAWVCWSFAWDGVLFNNSQPRAFAFVEVFFFECLLRASAVGGIAIHEAAHLLAALAVLFLAPWQSNEPRLIFSDGIRFHIPSCPASCAPFSRLQSSWVSLSPGAAASLCSMGPAAEVIIRMAGLVVSVLVSLLAMFGTNAACWHATPMLAVSAGASLPVIGAVLSDLPCGPLLGPRAPTGCYCCGNWGVLLPREALEVKAGGARQRELMPSVIQAILTSVLDIVELRGAQAGGCVTFLGGRGNQVQAVCSKTVKSKRGHLATQLFGRFNQELRRRSVLRWLRCDRLQPLPVILAQGHSRFGTSSMAAVVETHPHQWLGPRSEWVWQPDETGEWHRRRITICTTITHNGDYDGAVLYGKTIPNDDLGEWLARILQRRHVAKGDSPKVAGMMDLLVCQGVWLSSVRYAFAFQVLRHVNEAFGWEIASPDAPSAVPPRRILKDWAKTFEEEFKLVTDQFGKGPSPDTVEWLAARVTDALSDNRHGMSRAACQALSTWGLKSRSSSFAFCKEAVSSFFHRDLLSSVWSFFTTAVGTFGISVSCTLWPQGVVLAAKGQPVSLAFHGDSSMAFWSSEPSALNVSWPGRRERIAAARWDLDDARGEAVELRVLPSNGQQTPERAVDILPGLLGNAKLFPLPGRSKKMSYQIVVRGVNLGAGEDVVPLTYQAFEQRWVRLRSPPPEIAPKGRGDPIVRDLSEVPAILEEVEDSWTDGSALNCISGKKFAGCLLELLKARDSAQPHHPADVDSVDVLVFGVENSLWLGQQFAADLKRIFPRLKVTAMSSNWLLGLLQEGHGHIEPLNFALSRQTFRFSRGAVALGVSHSGTTYPTVWSARLLQQQELNIFAMSADFESLLANSIGQDMTDPIFSGNLFSTMAGVRPAEPSTLATLAMHHTLSLLLLTCAEQTVLHAREKGLPPPGVSRKDQAHLPLCQMRLSDVSDFKRVAHSLLPATERLCGVSRRRQALPESHDRTQLLQVGDYLASHLKEVWLSTLLAALYVYVTVTLGAPLFSWIWSLSVDSLPDLELGDVDVYGYGQYVVGFVDAHLYVFFAVLIATTHRLLTRRRLFTRYTNRSIVLVDSTVNYKLLRAYLSKLGALAYRFTSFGVAGQNGLDHFVHEMTHRTTSEVILVVGRQDGRLGTLAAAERATILASQQARYVASRSTSGIEMVSLGHNPWRKPGLFVRDVVLPTTFRPKFLSSTLLQSGEGPHDPLDVCHRAGRLAAGGLVEMGDPKSAPFSWVRRQDVVLMMSKPLVSKREANEVIRAVVARDSEVLGIELLNFSLEKVIEIPDDSPPVPSVPSVPAIKVRSTRSASPRSLAASSLTGSSLALTGEENKTSPIRQRILSATRSTRSIIPPTDDVSAQDIVAILHGRVMENYINQLRDERVRHRIKQSEEKKIEDDLDNKLLRGVFTAWSAGAKQFRAERIVKRRAKRQAGGLAQMRKQLPATAEWRVLEEYRRRRFQWVQSFQASQFGTRNCFQAWMEYTAKKRGRMTTAESDAAAGRLFTPGRAMSASPSRLSRQIMDSPIKIRRVLSSKNPLTTTFGRTLSPDKTGLNRVNSPSYASPQASTNTDNSLNTAGLNEMSDSPGADPVGSWFFTQASGKELLGHLTLLESLYETRVAAAERLLAAFIMFHRAVQPVSRLWGLSFSMDRSESRLRVASTPAPIAFVEELPARLQPERLGALPPASSASTQPDDVLVGALGGLGSPVQQDTELAEIRI